MSAGRYSRPGAAATGCHACQPSAPRAAAAPRLRRGDRVAPKRPAAGPRRRGPTSTPRGCSPRCRATAPTSAPVPPSPQGPTGQHRFSNGSGCSQPRVVPSAFRVFIPLKRCLPRQPRKRRGGAVPRTHRRVLFDLPPDCSSRDGFSSHRLAGTSASCRTVSQPAAARAGPPPGVGPTGHRRSAVAIQVAHAQRSDLAGGAVGGMDAFRQQKSTTGTAGAHGQDGAHAALSFSWGSFSTSMPRARSTAWPAP
jgi:hypothetical protein